MTGTGVFHHAFCRNFRNFSSLKVSGSHKIRFRPILPPDNLPAANDRSLTA